MSSITVTHATLDLSGMVWRYMTPPVKGAIYTYHQIKGADAGGEIYIQGKDNATFTIYGRCALSSTNSTVLQALNGEQVTVTSSIHGTFSCYITNESHEQFNPAWMQFTITVMVV